MSDEIRLCNCSESLSTSVSNIFLDKYMPAANGEFVKIYLYLLRCMNTDNISLSISKIADKFEHTENDVCRALKYWEKNNLLNLEYDKDQHIVGINILNVATLSQNIENQNAKVKTVEIHNDTSNIITCKESIDFSETDNTKTDTYILETQPDKKLIAAAPVENYTADELSVFKKKSEVKQLLFIAEQYLGKTLTSTEITKIIYFYDALEFSSDLIEYLIDYCVSNNHKSIHYIEKVALSWHQEHIATEDEAKEYTSLYNTCYSAVMKAFGIRDRNLIETEIEYIDKWNKHYNFSPELISEACIRTMMNAHQPSFKYADSIMTDWHKNNVARMSDLKTLDEKHTHYQESSKKKQNAKEQSCIDKNNKFNNFPQRTYDYAMLEKQLLRNQQQ